MTAGGYRGNLGDTVGRELPLRVLEVKLAQHRENEYLMGSIYYPIKANEFFLEVLWPISSFNRGLVRAWLLWTPFIPEPEGGKRGPWSKRTWAPQSQSLVSTATVPLGPGLPPELRVPSWRLAGPHRAPEA